MVGRKEEENRGFGAETKGLVKVELTRCSWKMQRMCREAKFRRAMYGYRPSNKQSRFQSFE